MSTKEVPELGIVKREPSYMEIVQQIVAMPNAREQVEVMKELLAMQERAEDRNAKREFFEALARIQAKLPQFQKRGSIKVGGVERSKYVML